MKELSEMRDSFCLRSEKGEKLMKLRSLFQNKKE